MVQENSPVVIHRKVWVQAIRRERIWSTRCAICDIQVRRPAPQRWRCLSHSIGPEMVLTHGISPPIFVRDDFWRRMKRRRRAEVWQTAFCRGWQAQVRPPKHEETGREVSFEDFHGCLNHVLVPGERWIRQMVVVPDVQYQKVDKGQVMVPRRLAACQDLAVQALRRLPRQLP